MCHSPGNTESHCRKSPCFFQNRHEKNTQNSARQTVNNRHWIPKKYSCQKNSQNGDKQRPLPTGKKEKNHDDSIGKADLHSRNPYRNRKEYLYIRNNDGQRQKHAIHSSSSGHWFFSLICNSVIFFLPGSVFNFHHDFMRQADNGFPGFIDSFMLSAYLIRAVGLCD